jgi:hypothetical protein
MKIKLSVLLSLIACLSIVDSHKGMCQSAESYQAKFSVIDLAENGRVYISAGSDDGAYVGMKVTFFEKGPTQLKDGKPVYDLYPIASSTIQRTGKFSSIVVVDTVAFRLLHPGSPVQVAGEIEIGKNPVKPLVSVLDQQKSVVMKNSPQMKKQDDAFSVPIISSTSPTAPALQAAPQNKQPESKIFNAQTLGFKHTPPTNVTIFQGVPITLYAPSPMKNPKLYYRVHGTIDYKEIDLTPKPNNFYFYEISKEEVVEPAIDYYLTVKAPSGEETLVLGNPETPISIPVSGFVFNPQLELARHRGNRNMIRVMSEQVTYNDSDSYRHYEIDYMYRIFTTLYSIRMGMGAFDGQGLSTGAASGPMTLQSQKYYYGYTEGELAIPSMQISLIGRFLTGINNDGIGSGFETKARFGDELGVNLVAAVWTASRLGTSTSIQLNVPISARFGFSGNIAAEDLPVKGNTGFRMAVDLRYAVFDDFDVTGRVGMSARQTNFIGTNLGLGIVRHF